MREGRKGIVGKPTLAVTIWGGEDVVADRTRVKTENNTSKFLQNQVTGDDIKKMTSKWGGSEV